MKFGNLLNESSDIRGSSQRESDIRSHQNSTDQPPTMDTSHAPSSNASSNPASPVESTKSARFSIGSLMNNDKHSINILNPSPSNISHPPPAPLQTPYREHSVLQSPGAIPFGGNGIHAPPSAGYFQHQQPQPPQHQSVPQMLPPQSPPSRPAISKRSSISALLNNETVDSKPVSESVPSSSSSSSPRQQHAQILNPIPQQPKQGQSNYPDQDSKQQIQPQDLLGQPSQMPQAQHSQNYKLEQENLDHHQVHQHLSISAPFSESSMEKAVEVQSGKISSSATVPPQITNAKKQYIDPSSVEVTETKEIEVASEKLKMEKVQANTDKMDIDDQEIGDDTKAEEANNTPKKAKPRVRRAKKMSNVIRPHKYENPPIWAQDWVQLTKIKANMHNNTGQSAAGIVKDGASLSTAYSTELDVSITKAIPYEDLTRRVTEWLYAHLNRLDNYQSDPSLPQDRGELLKYLELEVKFGRIWSKERDSRINLPISTESIIINQVDYNFKPGVEPVMFDKLRTFLMGIQGKDMAAFKVLDTNNIDYFYHGVRVNEKPYDLRLTKDATTNRTIATIEKRRIADLFINNPSNILDFRISLSLELPIDNIPKEIKGKKPNMIRNKVRKSYISERTKTRMDLTDTTTEMSSGRQHSFEVEVESKIPWLMDSYRSLNKGDSFTYQDTIKVLLDNCRILNRSLDN